MRHARAVLKLRDTTREYIERLVKEEHRLLAQQTLADSDQLRIEEIHVILDRCCDVLHQRRTGRERQQIPGQLGVPLEAIGR